MIKTPVPLLWKSNHVRTSELMIERLRNETKLDIYLSIKSLSYFSIWSFLIGIPLDRAFAQSRSSPNLTPFTIEKSVTTHPYRAVTYKPTLVGSRGKFIWYTHHQIGKCRDKAENITHNTSKET